MASSLKQKFKNIGPGALVAAGFVGPGTVTTCTVSGASYGYTMLWCLLFATVATIIFQEMASRIGIATQEGLGENIRDRISNPALKWIAIVIVIIAIFIGNTAYETGNITGGILGIQAVFDVPIDPHRHRARHPRLRLHVGRLLQAGREDSHGHRRAHGRRVLRDRPVLPRRLGRGCRRSLHAAAASRPGSFQRHPHRRRPHRHHRSCRTTCSCMPPALPNASRIPSRSLTRASTPCSPSALAASSPWPSSSALPRTSTATPASPFPTARTWLWRSSRCSAPGRRL